MSTDDKVFVKITRPTFIAAHPAHAGEVISVTPAIARELFNADAAEPFAETQPPAVAAPVIETATATVEKETATAPAKVARKKKA